MTIYDSYGARNDAVMARCEAAYLTPPDDPDGVCTCGHGFDYHDETEEQPGFPCRADGCGCPTFTEYDAYQAAEDAAFEAADIAWKERGL